MIDQATAHELRELSRYLWKQTNLWKQSDLTCKGCPIGGPVHAYREAAIYAERLSRGEKFKPDPRIGGEPRTVSA